MTDARPDEARNAQNLAYIIQIVLAEDNPAIAAHGFLAFVAAAENMNDLNKVDCPAELLVRYFVLRS